MCEITLLGTDYKTILYTRLNSNSSTGSGRIIHHPSITSKILIQGQMWLVPEDSDVKLVLHQSSYLYYHFIKRVTLHIPDSHSLHALRPPQVGDHDLHQPGQVYVVLPAPLRPGQGVIEHHGPGVSNVLPRVWAVLYLEVGDPLLNLSVCMLTVCCASRHFTSSNISSGVKLMACTL